MVGRMPKKVSVVIPTLEEESVFKLVKQIRRVLGNGVEIIIVDKSSDKYFRRLRSTGAKLIRQRGRGVENAVMVGLRAAKGEYIASIDADGTHDPEGLAEALKMVESGKADFVLGNRMNGLSKGSMQLYLRFGNSILSGLYSTLYHQKIHDVLTGLFVVSREAFEDIRNVEPYRAGIAFFAIELARRGYTVKEVDIKYYKRAYGESKLTRSKFAYGFNVASHIVRQLRDYSPLLIFGLVGGILFIIGLILGIQVLADFFATGVFAFTGRALLAFMLLVIGFLLVIAGLILDLLLEIERKLEMPNR
ncbi:MAG: glycosyltransferase family 2 protein [Candidatus Marsarchaeota archaeon]|jgi:glycosyltransferase involved in cell wall biosynthesis|nr:glycosyltransferase family 2 protein [Candidatus Marsarchaeota archaeon]